MGRLLNFVWRREMGICRFGGALAWRGGNGWRRNGCIILLTSKVHVRHTRVLKKTTVSNKLKAYILSKVIHMKRMGF
jgi:hypothetical protein